MNSGVWLGLVHWLILLIQATIPLQMMPSSNIAAKKTSFLSLLCTFVLSLHFYNIHLESFPSLVPVRRMEHFLPDGSWRPISYRNAIINMLNWNFTLFSHIEIILISNLNTQTYHPRVSGETKLVQHAGASVHCWLFPAQCLLKPFVTLRAAMWLCWLI